MAMCEIVAFVYSFVGTSGDINGPSGYRSDRLAGIGRQRRGHSWRRTEPYARAILAAPHAPSRTSSRRSPTADSDEAGLAAPTAAVARSAGITVGLMVLTSVAFVAGAWLAGRARPISCSPTRLGGRRDRRLVVPVGALAAAAVLAVGVVAVGMPWCGVSARRATSTSTP